MSRAVPFGTPHGRPPRRREGSSPPSSKRRRREPLLDITNQNCLCSPSVARPLRLVGANSPQLVGPPSDQASPKDEASGNFGVQQMTVRLVCTGNETVEYSKYRPALQAMVLCAQVAEGCVDAEWEFRWRRGSFLETVRSQQLIHQRPLTGARLAIRAAANFWEVVCHRSDSSEDNGTRSSTSSCSSSQSVQSTSMQSAPADQARNHDEHHDPLEDIEQKCAEESFSADITVASFESGGRLVWGAQVRAPEAPSQGWFIALHCYKGGILETGHVWVSLVYDGVIVAPVGLNPLRERDPDTFVEKLQEFRRTMLGTHGVVQHEAATFDYVVERGLQLRSRVWPINEHAVAVFSRLVQDSRRGGCRFTLSHQLKVAIGEEYEEEHDSSSESPSPPEQPEDCLDFLSLAESPPHSPIPNRRVTFSSAPTLFSPRPPIPAPSPAAPPPRPGPARPSAARQLARRRLSAGARGPSTAAAVEPPGVDPPGAGREHLCPCTAAFCQAPVALSAVSGPETPVGPPAPLPATYRLPAYLTEADHPRLEAGPEADPTLPWGCVWASAGSDKLSIVWAVPYFHVVTQRSAPQPVPVRWHGASWQLWFQADVCCVRVQVQALGLCADLPTLVTLAALGQDSGQTCSVAFPEVFGPAAPSAASHVANVPLWQLLRYGGTFPSDVPLGPRRYLLLSAVLRAGHSGPSPPGPLQMSPSAASPCLADRPPAEMTEIGVVPYHLPGLLGEQCTTWALKLLARVLEAAGSPADVPALVHPNAVWDWIAQVTS